MTEPAWRGWLAIASRPLPRKGWLLGLLALTLLATFLTHRTLLGRDDHPGELTGYGDLPPAIVPRNPERSMGLHLAGVRSLVGAASLVVVGAVLTDVRAVPENTWHEVESQMS